jgi:leucyl/phenylalanyl-tRNA--protein transferase
MSSPLSRRYRLTPEVLLRAYSAGIFPMAESRHDPSIFWVDPERRGILPMDEFHVPKRLRKTIRRGPFEVTCDTAFEAVMCACAEPTRERHETWINDEIIRAYTRLHHMGFAHSIECRRDGKLVGGCYGVAVGGAFCGESMFSRVTDASKVALVHLIARLRYGDFVLVDVQFVTDHLKTFGAVEVPARHYLELLDQAINVRAAFYSDLAPDELNAALEVVMG